MTSRGFKIVDADGGRATIGSYFTEEQARSDIAAWVVRKARGGRPDLSTEFLVGLQIVEEDGLG